MKMLHSCSLSHLYVVGNSQFMVYCGFTASHVLLFIIIIFFFCLVGFDFLLDPWHLHVWVALVISGVLSLLSPSSRVEDATSPANIQINNRD